MKRRAVDLIDIHAHIVPGVDDGSRYLGESVELIKAACQQGVRGILATPHYHRGHNRVKADKIRERFERMRQQANELLPDVTLYLGEELFYYEGVSDALAEGRALTLNGTDYVLVEFSPAVSYQELYQAVRRLTQARFLPVLAHVERYACLRQDERLEELTEAGAYMQMNYESLAGTAGLSLRRRQEQAWCRKQVEEGRIHLAGSDMHRLDYRPPKIVSAARWLESRGFLELLAKENPRRLLAGQPLLSGVGG